jgi:hypothetical protein
MFDWSIYPMALLRDLARESGLRVTSAAADLQEEFSSPPRVDFVDRLWSVLRDGWLDGTPESRASVATALRAKGLGDRNTEIRTKSGQMRLITSCLLSDDLRSIVLQEFIKAGSVNTVAGTPVNGEGEAPEQPDRSANARASREPDAGVTSVELLKQHLMIDDEWATEGPRRLTWWSYRLAQHIEACEPFAAPDGAVGSVVRIWTEVVRGVDSSHLADVVETLAAVNMQASMSALIFDPEQGTIHECSTSVVYDDTYVSWARVLAASAVFQNTSAHSKAHAIAQAFGGQPAASNHPLSGQRGSMDDLLNGPAAWASDAGSRTSAFQGTLMQSLLGFATSADLMAAGDESGFTCELPFGEGPSAAELAMSGRSGRSGTALLQVTTNEAHPQLGSGALVILRLPFPFDADAALKANYLNAVEFSGQVPTKLLGSWCAPEGQLTYVSFLPSMLAQPGVLENLLVDAATRVAYARDLLVSDSA